MPHTLTPDQCQQFDRDGYLAPLAAFTPAEALTLRVQFEAFEQQHGKQALAKRTDLHIAQRWAWDVITHSNVVDPVVSLLGPNVLLWSINWFIKEPRDGKFVSLHQDANYWGLEPYDVITAWIALSDASLPTGPMRFLPGSHKQELHDHTNTYAKDNLLSRGQAIETPLDNSNAVLAPLSAGEMSLHHVRLIHGSDKNTTDDRRIGMVLRYCATHVRQTKGADSAVLVAGEDHHGNFELLPRPEMDFGPAESERHARSVRRMGEIIHSDPVVPDPDD